MREIKFRAWYYGNEYDKPIMIYDIQNSYDFGCNDVKYDNEVCFGNYLDDENYVVMQYIGFEDNNGKKIYEGDIINIDYGEVVVKAVVEYCGASFFGSTNADNWDLNEYHKIEVLGNIYENPELMED